MKKAGIALLVVVALMALVFLMAWGAVPASPEIVGRVVEADTGRPIPGALVVASISGDGSRSLRQLFCIALRTDGDGRFRIPAWKWSGGRAMSLGAYGARMTAYHPDYNFYGPGSKPSVFKEVTQVPVIGTPLPSWSEVTIPMHRFDKTDDKAWSFKLGLPIEKFNCDWDGDKRNADLVWDVMHEEVAEYSDAHPPPQQYAGSETDRLKRATGRPIEAKIIAPPPASTIAARTVTVGPMLSSAAPSPTSIRITRVSPDPSTTLRVGQRVNLVVNADYTIGFDTGNVVLTVQAADHKLVSSTTQSVPRGSGTVTVKAQFVVPETDAIEIYTPIMFPGAARAPTHDKRKFAVIP